MSSLESRAPKEIPERRSASVENSEGARAALAELERTYAIALTMLEQFAERFASRPRRGSMLDAMSHKLVEQQVVALEKMKQRIEELRAQIN